MLWVISVPYKREIYVHPHYIDRFLQCMQLPYHHCHDIAVEEQDDLRDQTRWGS